MKLHLPVRLLRAVIIALVAVPASLYAAYTSPEEITVSDTYTNSVELNGTAEFAAQTEDTAFRLTGDVTMSPSGVGISGVSYLYTSDSADSLASLTFTKPSGSKKNAFYVNSPQLTFDSLNEVSFTSFSSNGIYGGAIGVNATGNLIFSNNAKVACNSNKVIPSGNAANGGAISIEGTASFLNNGEVIFNGNEARSQGGAIALDRKRDATADTHLVIDGNDTVTFHGNKTNNQLAGLGGALYNILGNMQLNHNGDVTISSNTARATYMAQGGAIYSTANGGSGLTVELSYNDSLTFKSNLAQSGNYNATDGNAYGGAILASGTSVILNSNGSLTFKDNKAYTTKTNWVAQGGAIRIGYGAALSIQNNDSAIFENNQTQVGSTAKYNSIYADDSSVLYNGTVKTYELNVDISAPEEGSVEFRDCVYIDVSQHEDSYFNLNSKYTDEKGQTIAQTGDIIFTGAYMTSGDKTSVFKGTASLNDGRLLIKDGAVLQADTLVIGFSVSDKSTPTLELSGAKVNAITLTFGTGTTLVCNGVDNDSAAMITVSESLTMSNSVVLGLSGNFSGETLKVAVAGCTGSETNWVTLAESTNFTVNSLLWTVSDLSWSVEDGTAYVTGTAEKKDVVDISNTDMVLDSENALGDGTPVVSTGTTSLTTEEGVTVVLPGAIQNGGDLTMGGSYDGSELSTVTVEDTHVDANGTEGNNGFFRKGGEALVVVENTGEATLTVDGNTTVTDKNGEDLQLYASGLATKELDYSGYHIEDADHTATMSEITDACPEDGGTPTITMNNGTLVADCDATDVQAKGGTISTEGDVTVGGNLSGKASVVVGEGTATLTGDNDHTGDTIISGTGRKLIVGGENALGKSTVQVKDGGALDLNSQSASNLIQLAEAELHNASAFNGSMEVSGELTLCGTDATAKMVKMAQGATISAEDDDKKLTADTLSVSNGNSTIDAHLEIAPDGSIVLNDGSMLTMKRSLTLGDGASIVLNGGNYASGDTLMVIEGDINKLSGKVRLANGYGLYTMDGFDMVLTALYDRNLAETFTAGNWGQVTASRAFVNAVRGQHSNTSCLADGRGTVWATVLGSNQEICSYDINLKGAAIGSDMKVGETSSVGVAFGFIEGDVTPSGLRTVDQESTYVALYGEHGLAKLSSTSCLSMDWVAAYGNVESKQGSTSWEQDSLQLNSRVSWNKKLSPRFCMSTFAGLEYYTNDSATVKGAETGSVENLRGEIGISARYVALGNPAGSDSKENASGCEKLVLKGEIRYMNDMVRDNPVVRMDGLSGSADNPGRQGIGIEVGATYNFSERWSTSVNYGFNTMDDFREHRVNVGVSYSF